MEALTFHDLFDSFVYTVGDRPALTFLGATDDDVVAYRYAELQRRALSIAAAIATRSRPGDRALIVIEPSAAFLETFLGCLYARVIAVPAYPPEPTRLERTLARLMSIVRDAEPTLVLTSRLVADAMGLLTGEAAALLDTPRIIVDEVAESASCELPAASPNDIAFLQYTSGSTADAKGVMISHANLLHNTRYLALGLPEKVFTCTVGWAPPYHDMGLIGTVLATWATGGHAVQMAPASFLASPQRWLRAIDRYRAAGTFAPPFALDFAVRRVAAAERAAIDLGSLVALGIGGEPVDPGAVERFAAAFSASGLRREVLLPGYGLAEHTVWVMCSPPTGEPGVGFDRAALQTGRAQPAADGNAALHLPRYQPPDGEVQALIVNPDRQAVLPDGAVGELWLQSPSVACGYWNKPELSRRTFEATLAGRPGTFLRTGDLGFRHAGQLFLTGRAKDVLIVRGLKHAPQDLELTVQAAHPAIRPGRCCAFEGRHPDDVVVLAEVKDADARAVIDAVRARVAREHGLTLADVLLLPVGALVKTGNGKLSRQGCRAAYLRGLTPANAATPGPATSAMTAPATLGLATALESALRGAIAGHLRCTSEAIDPTKPLGALGLDSLMVVQLCAFVDERFGVRLAPGAFLEGHSLTSLCATLATPGRLELPPSLVSDAPAPIATPLARPAPSCAGDDQMAFSLTYFPTGNLDQAERFSLMLRTAQFADQRGFAALWIPERHFHPFGGSCPNPSVIAGAFAATTQQIRLRAGSVVLPLHNPVRVAEEWSVVDNLSRGRVDLAFASGWNANDFVLAPAAYADRRHVTLAGIETIQRLWRNGDVALTNGIGAEARIRIQPEPVQKDLAVWYTCTGGMESFILAGGNGFNVLTGLLFQSLEDLEAKIALYRQARERHGHDPRSGKVTLMLHTYVGDTMTEVRSLVREPLTRYLASSVELWGQEAERLRGLSAKEQAAMLDFAVDRYQQRSALIGTPQTCARFVERLQRIGVNEIACLIDFGLATQTVLAGLGRLDRIRSHFAGPALLPVTSERNPAENAA
jgi:natural product biosynthesis luciferase-like monooxygenase protein